MKGLFGSVQRDLPASIVVFLVAVPLCLGVALASGAPPIAGLLAGVIGGVVVGGFSGSQLGVSGPAAGLAAIVLTSIATLGSFEAFLLSVVLAGAMQVLMGVARGGVIAYFFPSGVIKGMLAGIGVFIALTQFPHAFGYDKEAEVDSLTPGRKDGVFADLGHMFADPNYGALLIAVACTAVLILWERPFIKRHRSLAMVPGPLLAVVLGVVLSRLSNIAPQLALGDNHYVQLPDLTGTGLRDLFPGPDWSRIGDPLIWTTALTMAFVASLETLLSVEAADKLDPEKRITPKDRELRAQGIGNLLAGLVGALPVTQVIVRSSANIQTGARTKLSAMLHGMWILLAVLLIPSVLKMIPLAALAAILIQVGFKLAKPKLFKEMWQGGWTMFVPFIVTVSGVVFLDLLKGVLLGMAVAVFVILRNNYKIPFLLMERDTPPGGPICIQLSEDVSFLNKASIQRALTEMPPGTNITIDASRTIALDPDVLEILLDAEVQAKEKGATVTITGLRERRQMRVAAALSEKHVHETFNRTVNDAK
ncbi:MAG TPA: SulP family inorganic anion transporter [Flavobacteriales bacterium]